METKERILEKTEELFMRYGIRSITMDDIAKELAISKKTIYQFFTDKDDLVHQMGIRHFDQDKCQLSKINTEANNALEHVILMSRHLKNKFRDVNPSLFFDLQRYHPKTWTLWQNHKKNFIVEEIKQNIIQGIAEGFYRSDIEVESLAIMRVMQIEMAFSQDIFPSEKFDLLTLQVTFLEHFIRGIVSEKGFQLLSEYFDKEPKRIFQPTTN